MESVFMVKEVQPTNNDLSEKLGATFKIWSDLKNYLAENLKSPGEEWNYPGKKYGWSFRMKSKKRNIIYFLPKDGYFKVAFVFGQKATDAVLGSSVKDSIKKELSKARIYSEGRGIRIDIQKEEDLGDVKKLIQIKLDN